ncbi:unnamed protein product [Prorocentrum cordatum]|uniref:Uncharacterized protein n=1 Tax=Prorocentrum cordatum TaxID=2364126 RepID=A0ABN9Y1Y3_9DINO|nr:unnamed protein product [Polarella glacialis]
MPGTMSGPPSKPGTMETNGEECETPEPDQQRTWPNQTDEEDKFKPDGEKTWTPFGWIQQEPTKEDATVTKEKPSRQQKCQKTFERDDEETDFELLHEGQMPPKGNKKAAKPKSNARPDFIPEKRARGPAADVNATYNSELLAAAATVKARPISQDLATSTGPQFDVEQRKKDMEAKGVHRFDGNAFLAVIKCYDDAPINRKRVNDWQTKHYDSATGHLPPPSMNYTLKIATLPQDGGLEDVNKFGKFALVSPPEPLDALAFRVANAISDGDDDAPLAMWREAILTAPLMIMTVESAAKVDWKRIDERESFGRSFEMLCRTALGRAFEVLDIIAKEEDSQKRELSPNEV